MGFAKGLFFVLYSYGPNIQNVNLQIKKNCVREYTSGRAQMKKFIYSYIHIYVYKRVFCVLLLLRWQVQYNAMKVDLVVSFSI